MMNLIKGGDILASGGFGCVFKPALRCKNSIRHVGNNTVSKLMTAKQSSDKPTIIFIKTTIGYGSIAAGKSSVHGAPLGQTNTQNLKEYFGFDKTKSFFVDEDVQTYFDELKKGLTTDQTSATVKQNQPTLNAYSFDSFQPTQTTQTKPTLSRFQSLI